MIPAEQADTDSRWLILHAKLFEVRIIEAFKLFREEGIEPILIKGWAAARFYTKKDERFYTDIDLCVEPSAYGRATLLLENEAAKNLSIDLHEGLRHLDTVSWSNLFENSVFVNLEDSKIRLLRAEDHLRVLCVHWLTDGGAFKEKLWDIYYAVENRPADFDWERCLGVVSENRRRWIICTIGLARKYLGLSLKNTPIEKDAENLPEWLVKSVEKEWKSGVRLKPLHRFLNDRKQFFEQISKRLPPNPIQATILMEGSFDHGARFFYQIGSAFKRIAPSIKRIKKALRARGNLPK